MCKKLIYSCFILVLVVMTVPASADPITATNPLRVDINGENAAHDPARTQAGWTGWDFERGLTKACYSATFHGGQCEVEICGFRHDGQMPGTRMRGDLCSWEFGDVYQDLFFVGHSGDGVALGMDYIQLTVFGCLEPETQYNVGIWSFDTAFGSPHDKAGTDWSAWGVVNPREYLEGIGMTGGYQVTLYDDPCTTDVNESGIYKNPVPTLDRIDNQKNYETGLPKGQFVHWSDFCVTTDEYGVLKVYGWHDADSWSGSQHVPINGFEIIPEPATIALLGLGGLALLRRRRR